MANESPLNYKGDGKTHTVRLRGSTLTYWRKGVATGHAGADRVVVTAPMGGPFPNLEFNIPSQIGEITSIIALMDDCFTVGKRKAKHELRRWLEIDP